jgi:OOP family OmpA-OmpF porin
MKAKLVFSIAFLFLISVSAPGQVVNPLKKIHKKGVQKTNKAIDEGIDKAFEEPKDDDEQKKTEQEAKEPASEKEAPVANEQQTQETDEAPQLVWSKYDFVPGDKVIFEDDLLGEENGEFPSRWDLMRGNVEIAEFGGENVIMFRDGAPIIMPYFKDASKDYLPEVFTIEFDLYCGNDNFVTYLYDRKNQKSDSQSGYTDLKTNYHQMEFGQSSSRLPDEKNLEKRRWVHVAVAYTNGKLKAYMDETRLINIPRLDFDPKGLSFHSYHCRNDNLYYVKNIRIAEGGVKYYDRLMQDGKIVANGIRFDVGKATLKPESMGIINEMVEMMQEHPDLKFSIEGHTDSDGDDNSNLKLSEERAQTVKNTMVQLGISADRLSIKGFGESTPMDTNSTPEGKANNRRVEFVKI